MTDHNAGKPEFLLIVGYHAENCVFANRIQARRGFVK